MRAIVWFRQDLRIHDNSVLAEACRDNQEIIPLYILEDENELGDAQKWWLHHALTSLSNTLNKHGLQFLLRQGQAKTIFQSLLNEHEIDRVYWSERFEPKQIKRDEKVRQWLLQQDVEVIHNKQYLLIEPQQIKNQQGDFFKVFTPFWRHCLQKISPPNLSKIDHWPKGYELTSEKLEDWQLLPSKPNWAETFSEYWQPGEQGASQKLETFLEDAANDYKVGRDFPDKVGTSRLSPHLHFGEISPWQIWRAVEQAKTQSDANLKSLDVFLSELGWREFSYYLLYHFPELPDENFQEKFNQFSWQSDTEKLNKWQKGQTGFPIVDAGMRELWQTGYMHNRVRMIVASFLTKDLLIDWREGAAWFYNTLLDADLANNSAGWQWVAGSGADAAPYFRIFNPTLQSEKFDPQGNYIKQWVPELREVSKKWIHNPNEAPGDKLPVKIGENYPEPIVNHAQARKLALTRYEKLKK